MVSGKKVKLLRLNNGWSQDQLAEISGLGIRTIQRIEKEGKCSLESKLALSSAFSISPDQLLETSELSRPLNKGINWDGVIGLTISFSIIGILLTLSGNLFYYFDFWTILLVTGLPFGLSCISSGVRHSATVYSNISWLILLPANLESIPFSIPCIRRVINYVYISGLFGTVVSLIAIFSNITPQNPDFWPAMAIAFISLFNALIFSEVILRPLKHKYEQLAYMAKHDLLG